jgi:ABC-type phosphonate transport system ATPase subunit
MKRSRFQPMPALSSTGNIMKTYTVGTKVFLDFAFSGKPLGVVTKVLAPGSGKMVLEGKIEVRITGNRGAPAYRVGERLTTSASVAVPRAQEFRKPGSCFRWVNTDYAFA